jgi:hypothetical protein
VLPDQIKHLLATRRVTEGKMERRERKFTSVELQLILIMMQIVILYEITLTSPKWTTTMTEGQLHCVIKTHKLTHTHHQR